jgi:hypothetical protein
MATPQASPLGANARLKFPLEVPWDASLHNAPAAATAAVVTMAADALRPNVIAGIHCSYTAVPAGGAVQIEDGSGTVVWKQYLAGAGPHQFLFDPPRSFTPGTATIVTLASGGGAVVGVLDVSGYKVA